MAAGRLYSDDDLPYMPEVEAAARRRGSRFAYLLSVLTLLFFASFAVWAHFAVVGEVTRGEGTVIPSRKTQVVQNLEGGILADILVREGDIVDRGHILVRIDNTAAKATYRDAQLQHLNLRATVARLEAELEGRE